MASAERYNGGPGAEPGHWVTEVEAPPKLETVQFLDAQRKQQICLIFCILQTH